MTQVPPAGRRSPSVRSALRIGFALAFCGACVGPSEVPASSPRAELSAKEFRELLAKGTIQPVEAMKGEDAFAKTPEEFGEFAHPPETPTGAQAPATPPTAPPAAENPYLIFGERIKVNPDGTITKPYPLRVGTGAKMKALIEAYGNFPLWTAEMGTGPSTPGTVKLDLLAGWDIELYQDLRNVAAKEGPPTELADWLVITTGKDLLYEVEDFINLFAAGVPQIEIEAKIVEITLSDTLDLGSKTSIDAPGSGTFIKGFGSTTPNSIAGNEALLTLGGVFDGITFDAILDAIAGRDNVSIISRPKIAVREGGRADISNIQSIPYLKIGAINPAGGGYASTVDYKDVGVKLYVVPRVVGTQTVALNIDVEASQVSGRELLLVTGSGDQVSSPVLSNRSARTIVYLQPGQAVILGGLITERKVDQVQKVPLLGDVPILGYLFSSHFTRKEQANVLFFIRPRILQGVDVHREF
jgi:type II secretory pathway component GspD/PulD (secretin)